MVKLILGAKLVAPRFRYVNRLKKLSFGYSLSGFGRVLGRVYRDQGSVFAIGCSVAAGIETDSVLHQKLSYKDRS
jgi:hypothetical protein